MIKALRMELFFLPILPMMKTNKTSLWLALLVVVALAGVGLILYNTRSGPGLTSDSVIYLQGAQNLQRGRGFSRTAGDGSAAPIADFPPVFSAVLALLSFGNTDLDHLIQVGRWLNALLFGGNIFLASWLVRRYTGSGGVALLTSVLLVTFYRFIRIHSWLMTEGLFIFLLLLAILFLYRFFTEHRVRDILVASILMGFLVLSRYAGLAFWFSAIVSLWLFQGGDRKRRWLAMAIMVLVGLIPIGLWSIRNTYLTGEAVASRQVGWYPLKPEVIRTYLREGTAWIVPVRYTLPSWGWGMIAVVVVALLLIPYLWSRRWVFAESPDSEQRSEMALPGFLFVSLLLYLAMLVANSFLLDASTTVKAIPRYLLPGWVCFVILSICAVSVVLKERSDCIFPKLLVTSYIVFFLVVNIGDSIAYLRHAGYGLIDLRNNWKQEQQSLGQLDPSHPLISTDPERLYLLTGRPSYRTPRPYAVYTREENRRYQSELGRMRDMLQDGAFLVIVEPGQEDSTYLAELRRGLQAVIVETHIEVYRWNNHIEP